MALKLMKLFVSASTTTNAVPSNTRFFYDTTSQTAAGATLSIDAAAFSDDAGAAVVTLPALTASNSYFNVFVNGVLQMEGISTYTPGATTVGSLEIDVPAGGDPIPAETPIILEVVNFAPSSTTTVTT